jgi:hypothetical protein
LTPSIRGDAPDLTNLHGADQAELGTAVADPGSPSRRVYHPG